MGDKQSESPGKQTNSPAAERNPGGGEEEGVENKPITPLSPITINQTAPDAVGVQQQPKQGGRDPYDWIMLAFVLIATAGAVLAAIYTKMEVDIAREALKETQKTATAQIRAYVYVRIFSEIWGIPHNPHTRVDLVNGGTTPATDVNLRANIAIRNAPPVNGEFSNLPNGSSIDVIEANNEAPNLGIFQLGRAITDKEKISIQTGTINKIFVWGVVRYFDVLDKPHHTYFCYSFYGIKEYPNQIPAVNSGPRAGNRRGCPHPKND